MNTADSIAGFIHIQVRHRTISLYFDAFGGKPHFKRLDYRVILVEFCVDNAFQVFNADRQAKTQQITLCFNNAMIMFECQHGVEAQPEIAFKSKLNPCRNNLQWSYPQGLPPGSLKVVGCLSGPSQATPNHGWN